MMNNELIKRLKTTDGFIWMMCLDEESKKDDIFGYKSCLNDFTITDFKNHVYMALEYSLDLSVTYSQINKIISKTLLISEIKEAEIGKDFLEKALIDVIKKRNRMAA